MADAKTEKQKVQEITEKLEQGIKELFESEKYKTYLNTMSKFHNYSFNNTMLIAMQKPDATLVAGFKAWQKNFDRHVKKGEKGIRILAPAPYKIKEEQEKVWWKCIIIVGSSKIPLYFWRSILTILSGCMRHLADFMRKKDTRRSLIPG